MVGWVGVVVGGLTLWIGVRCSLTHLLQLLLCPLHPLLHLEHLETHGTSEEPF